MVDKLFKEAGALSDQKKAEQNARFFKTGKGEYGEGDVFLGLYMAEIRQLAKQYASLTFEQLDSVLYSELHEMRMIGTVCLTDRFKKAKSEEERRAVYAYYMNRLECINNWDLVDQSAHIIVGGHLYDKSDRSVLYKLVHDHRLFRRRVAVVATHYFIKRKDFKDILKLCEILMNDSEDLMQKACGWMLREVGKVERSVLDGFLAKYAPTMPRTMLRYAIEKHSAQERKKWMNAE